MTREEFATKILQHKEFAEMLKAVTWHSVRNEFPHLITPIVTPSEIDWSYMLFAASVLARSDRETAQDAALRIASTCLIDKSVTNEMKAGAAVVLHSLSNSPSIKLAEKRGLLLESILDQIPAPLQIDRISRGFRYSAVGNDNSIISLNKFQSEVHKQAERESWLTLSAPTSAGKSFVLSIIVEEFLRSNSGRVCFLVPTRALISQVEADLLGKLNSQILNGTYISSVPRLPKGWQQRRMILVMTQERLKWLIDDSPRDFNLDLLVVDESQKIGEGHRGILLEQALVEASARNIKMQTIFSSPLAKNPELLLRKKPISAKSKTIVSEFVAVNQNLIWVDQIPKRPKNWEVRLCLESQPLLLGALTLPETPENPTERLADTAFHLTPSGGSLIYADYPAQAEKIAIRLAEISVDVPMTEELKDLTKMIQDTIHKDYILAKILSKGIAFHYGNIPTLIRTEVERLFKEGKIKFLVCTATLIEGVNLGARTIFLRGPKKGKLIDLSEVDFWNLAGRAGRLGSDFQGNIVCIDVKKAGVWKTPPPIKRTRYEIRSASDIQPKTVARLIKYLEDSTPRNEANREPFLEYALTHYYVQFANNGKLDIPSVAISNPQLISDLEAKLKKMMDESPIPTEIIQRHPGISPLALKSLLQYFETFDRPLEQLIPCSPRDPDAVAKSYTRLMQRIFTHLSGDSNKLAMARAILVVSWTRGMPLSAIISSSASYWKKKGKKISWIIRNSMDEVEEFARFRFAKFSSAYLDLLRFFFLKSNRADLVSKLPSLHLWLEFGSSLETQISLMGLGLSRTAAIAVSKEMGSDELDQDECAKQLLGLDVQSKDFASSIAAEISRVKANLAP